VVHGVGSIVPFGTRGQTFCTKIDNDKGKKMIILDEIKGQLPELESKIAEVGGYL